MRALWAALLSVPLSAQAQVSELPRFGDAEGAVAWAQARSAAMTPVPGRELPAPLATVDDPWTRVTSPSSKPPESIGEYSAGCLRGAVRLELSGPGFEVMHPERNRFYGHPRLLAFLRGLGSQASAAGLGSILIGDLGQPRGGPTLTGHASHQTGLDVDIRYVQVPAGTVLSPEDRVRMDAPSMVVPDFERLTKTWDPKELTLLRLTASSADVERVFVNPVIKREACRKAPGAGWLSKLRPWWGHDDHFHVRLFCSPGDSLCRHQEDVPSGDGCGAELASWFTPERKDEARRQRTEPGKPRTMPQLPAECRRVLTE